MLATALEMTAPEVIQGSEFEIKGMATGEMSLLAVAKVSSVCWQQLT